jgi:NTE family protein
MKWQGTSALDAPSFESNRDIHIVHVIYHPTDDQVSESDAEFSRPSIAKRRAAGYEDLRRAIHESPWTRHRPAGNGGTLVHRVHRGRLQANVPVREPSLQFMQDG